LNVTVLDRGSQFLDGPCFSGEQAVEGSRLFMYFTIDVGLFQHGESLFTPVSRRKKQLIDLHGLSYLNEPWATRTRDTLLERQVL
jgi:hypothetical protein